MEGEEVIEEKGEIGRTWKLKRVSNF